MSPNPKAAYQLEVTYKVNKDAINYLATDDALETGLYEAWFPLNFDYGKFTYTLNFKEVNNNILASNGYSKCHKDLCTLYSDEPDIDLILMASPTLLRYQVESTNYNIELTRLKSNRENAPSLESQIKETIQFYTHNFGALPDETTRFQFVFSPRDSGPSYSRNGFVVLTNFEQKSDKELLHVLSHEIAHLWWNLAPKTTWEDWLNESFAEYSAIMSSEALHDHASKKQKIAELAKLSQNLPVIKGLRRDNSEAQQVLYIKGPFILHQMREKVGDEAFIRWLQQIRLDKVTTTAELIILTERELGKDNARFLMLKLSQKT
ncbi:M1 family aminopeptidase [Alteromonas facilis]|uniref:M1 family aminopeptidase n=1 Tax=Alteromonas facilis TaxID=2048004 RepID=UPI000C28F0EC|nr:M1 family aminopeptidase [Alteromonas facilis]